jgi:hypothetical protein
VLIDSNNAAVNASVANAARNMGISKTKRRILSANLAQSFGITQIRPLFCYVSLHEVTHSGTPGR